MTHNVQQARNAYIYIAQAGAGAVLSFVTLPIYTRILLPAEFGQVALAQVYAVLLVSVANFGMVEVLERNYFQYRGDTERQGRLLFSCVLFVGMFSTLLGAISWAFLEPIAGFMGIEAAPLLILWALTGQAIANINNYFFVYLKNGAEAGKYATYNIVTALANALIGIYFVAYLRTGAEGMLYALVASAAIGLLLLVVTFARKYRFGFDFRIMAETLKLAYPMTPRILTGVLSSQLDKYLIRVMSTLGAVGIYAVAQRIAYFVFFFMTILQNVFGPEVYKRLFSGEFGKEHKNGEYLTTFLYISTLFSLVVVLFSPEITGVLLGAAYGNAAPVIALLAAFYAVQFPGKVTGKQLVYAKKTALISVLSVISLVISVLVMVPLVWKWGVLGAASGALITGILSNFVSFVVAQRCHSIDWQVPKMLTIYAIFGSGLVMTLVLGGTGIEMSTVLAKLGVLGAFIGYGAVIGVVSRKSARIMFQAAKTKRAPGGFAVSSNGER